MTSILNAVESVRSGIGRGRVVSELRRAANSNGSAPLLALAQGLEAIGDVLYVGAAGQAFSDQAASAMGPVMNAYGGYVAQTSTPSSQEVIDEVVATEQRVRRPIFGVGNLQNHWVTLSVVPNPGSQPVLLQNSSYPRGLANETTNMFVQSIAHSVEEPIQVISPFQGTSLKSIGSAPEILQISAILLESETFPWLAEWSRNYQNTIRGSKTLAQGTLIRITDDTSIYEGTIMSASVGRAVSTSYTMVTLQINMILDNWRPTAQQAQAIGINDGASADTKSPAENTYIRQMVDQGVSQSEAELSAQVIVASEMVKGTVAGISFPEFVISDNLNQATVYQAVNVGRAVARAAAANNAAGFELFNLRGVRENLIQDTRHLLQQSGQIDPIGSLLPIDANDDQQAIYQSEIQNLQEFNNGWVNQGPGGVAGIVYQDEPDEARVGWRGQ